MKKQVILKKPIGGKGGNDLLHEDLLNPGMRSKTPKQFEMLNQGQQTVDPPTNACFLS